MDEIFVKCNDFNCPHAFSTKRGGVSSGYFSSLNLGYKYEDNINNIHKNWRIFEKATNISVEHLVRADQYHKTDVAIVDKNDSQNPENSTAIGEYDGLVTNDKDVCLVIFTADCAPVLLYDSKAQVIAALHCGWKPFSADIIKAGIEQMQKLGASTTNISAVIGPCISKCCFETGKEVVDAIDNLLDHTNHNFYKKSYEKADKYYVDLPLAIKLKLQLAGIDKAKIYNIGQCSYCEKDKYFSYRRDNKLTGRMANIIKLPD